MQSNNNLNITKEDEIDLKTIFFRLLSKWHWFVLCGSLGILLAFFFSRFSQPIYDVKSVMLVQEESNGMGVENLFEGMDLGAKTNIENHIGILNSYSLNLQTLENLNWRTTWYQKGTFKDTDLYKNTPFRVIENSKNNLAGIKISISTIDNKSYQIKVDDKFDDGTTTYPIEFESTGLYGLPFKNDFFDFTLEKTSPLLSSEYYFVFNDFELMALDFVEKTNVSLVDKNAELIQLQMQGNTPARIVDYLNELCNVYIQFGLKKKNQISFNTVRFIDAQIDGIVDSLKVAGQNFTDFRSKKKSIDLSHEAQLILEKVGEIETEQASLSFQLDYFKNLLNYMGDADKMEKVAAPSVVGIVDPGLNSQVVKLGELYSKKSALSYIAKEKNPSLIMLNNEIKNVISSLEENLRNLLSAAETQDRFLKNRKDQITMRLAGLPETEQEMVNIKRRFDLNNELYTFLLKKRAEAAITTASNIPDAQIIDVARVRTAKKVGPKTLMIIVIGLMLGLLLPLFIILMKDAFNDSIKSKEELESLTSLPIVGEIAHNNYKNELAILDHPRSGLAESYRGLRTNLQYLFKGHTQKVIAIHSMIPGEGKTFTSLNIATIIAMDNKKVLLVGCDLRKPRLHQIFNTSNSNGLSTYLIRQHSLNEVTNTTKIKNLYFVNSGPIPPNPAELLGNVDFKAFINEAKKEYDYIILDNAPVTLVTDGKLTGKSADANLFVLRQGYSKRDQIKFINQQAEKNEIDHVGIILNDAIHNGHGNSYGSYGYGNGYYDEDHETKNWKTKLVSTFSRN
ncbi:polysaccharide biosynthesis tyrosine autokinase [Ancylomarina salipaludis]|uniref:non-specific protein-tyrosine kinase n=1 Tax=Ancylomarina salipaludis TaxID=2501299 RepID=A0A4Q1JK12_9BACT|nr:polysaccharide biosynthesis tyrosine autokinase [Ancylomarina salipaludis]RXQ91515.1 polysaccharide biosynthesis tyrosine autokinase [Ancylomarina salipaludis]